MRTSIRAALLVFAAALVAVQVAQPVSAHLVDREVFENSTPTIYDYSRRAEDPNATAVPTTTSSSANPSATAGTGCKVNSDCATGLCDTGKCVPQKGTGQNDSFCTSDAQCKSSSYCYRGSCQDIKQDGANCYKDSGCANGNCVNKKCIANASQPLKAQCTKSDQCTNGAFCSNGKCETIKPAGDYCYKNQGCTSNICINNKCSSKGLANNNQYCAKNAECKSNFCWKSACRAKRARNVSCSVDDACISNKCRKNKTCA
ncbi:keratin-associated protein 10-4 [Pseudozyma hubeiensis SY62]|uniref:Keratin-associated protein 10-4 n=1 Tax=Pseudozyma hubeiensis (strain SY62) TaxID=1305764 RepID=R9P3A7_PSEHS|nr:keratin-associated protein 10-4 [Pseudozyma hubeiensis SY62]GAC95779.1 keratin-associated protein 10-4 [Pseudozyma hubeiensis SY62]